ARPSSSSAPSTPPASARRGSPPPPRRAAPSPPTARGPPPPLSPPGRAARRQAPTSPSLTGGSVSWQNVAQVTISASPPSGANAGLAGFQYRSSTTNGTIWTTPSSGASATVTDEGTTLLQFRSVDNAGNTSAWTPTAASAASTAKIDRTVPTDPSTITGGSLSWLTLASATVTVSGSTDSPGSGISGYQYRLSTDGGTIWGSPVAGTAPKITAQGETLVQFRALDAPGLVSNWVPASPTAGSTVRLDRTLPSAPAVSGGATS